MQPRYWLAPGRPGVVMGDVPLLPDVADAEAVLAMDITCNYK